MTQLLLAQTTLSGNSLNFWTLLAVALGGVGIFLIQAALGRESATRTRLAVGIGLVIASLTLNSVSALRLPTTEQFLMLAFGWLATFGGIGFICFRQPVHSALSFALSVLASCGVFMLQSAPFIAAATTIIYAGATIIIFLFVLMFAQRSLPQPYDIQLSAPKLSLVMGGVLLALLFHSIQQLPVGEASTVNTARVADLGRAMYTDYLWTVELAGTLLLVATIGAIVIAQREPETVIESETGVKNG